MIRVRTDLLAPVLPEEEHAGMKRRAVEALGDLLERRGPGSEMLGWLDLPLDQRRNADGLMETGRRIRAMSDCLVVTGIGGSYLGARAGIEALSGEAEFPVYFAGNNLSPVYHDSILRALSGKRFSICAISKSGTTTEPAAAFRLLRALLERECAGDCDERIFVVTDPESGALRKAADERGWKAFDVPRGVGGRYSVLSPVGLLPMAAAGIEIGSMLEGASSAIDLFARPEGSNGALDYAAGRTALHHRGTAIEILSTFHPHLASLAEWWKQLAGESEGKEGKGLFPASAVMTTDLHSLGQLLQQGTRSILETFLTVRNPHRDLEVPSREEDLDGIGYLAGRRMSSINMKAFEGTRDAHHSGGLPVASIELDEVSPASVGALFVFFEIAVAVSGRLLGINPFDQPGVEDYKSRMFRLLGKPGA